MKRRQWTGREKYNRSAEIMTTHGIENTKKSLRKVMQDLIKSDFLEPKVKKYLKEKLERLDEPITIGQSIKKNPDSVKIKKRLHELLGAALELLTKKLFNDALKTFDEAISIGQSIKNPDEPVPQLVALAHVGKSNCLVTMGRYSEATREVKKGINIHIRLDKLRNLKCMAAKRSSN